MRQCPECGSPLQRSVQKYCCDKCRYKAKNRAWRGRRDANPETRKCSIVGCTRVLFAKGWCCAHFERWRRHGSPTAGGRPYGELEAFLRDVVLAYEGDECLIWPFSHIKGYGVIKHNARNSYVCGIVCAEKHGAKPSPSHIVAHSCGKGHTGCCNYRHLRWATPAENSADAIEHGATARGERVGNASLTAGDVLKIRSLRGVKSQSEIGALFGIHQASVSGIQLRKSWRHVA